MQPNIQEFYFTEFKKVFSEKNLRAYFSKVVLLDNWEYYAIQLDMYWWDAHRYSYAFPEIPMALIDLYALRLGELFKQFEERVDWLISKAVHSYHPGNSSDEDIEYVLLNNLRIIRKSSSPFPQYYLRHDAKSPCMLSSDKWIEVEASEVIKSRILHVPLGKAADKPKKEIFTLVPTTINHLKQGVDDLACHIFKMVTHSLFSSNHPNHEYLSGRADIDWARLRLSGRLEKDGKFFNGKKYSHSYSAAESIHFSHVAGLLGYIYLRKHRSKVDELCDEIKVKLESIYTQLFQVGHYQYLENILIKGWRQFDKICFFQFIKANHDELQFWEKDSPNKAFYAVYFNLNRNRLNEIPRDYFSYENMIAENSGKDLWANDRFLFPGKKSMKNAFKMNIAAFTALFPDGGCHAKYLENASKSQAKVDENTWRILTNWICSVNQPETISSDEIKKLRTHVERLFLGQVSTKTVEKFPVAVNLICQLMRSPNPLEEDIKSKISDSLDFIEGSELTFQENNHVVKSRRKNIHTLDSKTTIKSLERKSRTWHRMLELYNQSELLRRGEDYKKMVYDHLADLTIVEDGVSFTVLQNRYELLMEGVDMRHCVANYHERIKRGFYAVLSVKHVPSKNEGQYSRATLGIKLNGYFVSLDQCKGVYNAEINPDLLVIVNKVIKKLNDKSYVLYKRDMDFSGA